MENQLILRLCTGIVTLPGGPGEQVAVVLRGERVVFCVEMQELRAPRTASFLGWH
jgi:hypothetical protein